jgi:hypothetical protein
MDAAVKNDAFNPDQIVTILKTNTQVVETKDDEGQPTGSFEVKTTFNTKNEKGEPVTLVLSPSEVVKKMSQTDSFLNLFKDKTASGYGGRNTPRGALDIRELAKDPAAYRKARAEGKIDL